MNRTQWIGYMLSATALLITAIIFLRASSLMDNQARAEMVVNKDTLTLISTQFQGDTELIYVLDSRSGQLFAYVYNPNAGDIELLDVMDVSHEFQGGAAANPRDRGQRRAR